MADIMIFPDDPFDFIDEYSFEDKDHVYTNGSKLISVFRVKQALEHYFAKPSGWISVKKRPPKIGEKVLILSRYGHVSDTVFNHYGDGFYFDPFGYELNDGYVTHWMPRPEEPGEGTKSCG